MRGLDIRLQDLSSVCGARLPVLRFDGPWIPKFGPNQTADCGAAYAETPALLCMGAAARIGTFVILKAPYGFSPLRSYNSQSRQALA
jgi:hypothetical protein